MPSALVLIADGTEEMEFTITYDTLVRAGVDTTSASVGLSTSPYATCSRGVRILPDATLEKLSEAQIDAFDAVVVPGGAKGAETLAGSEAVQRILRKKYEEGKVVGVVCAGSLAAKSAGIGKGKNITSHPSVKGELEGDYQYSEDRVVTDADNLISSRGPGTSFGFALALVERLVGKQKRDEVQGPMVLGDSL